MKLVDILFPISLLVVLKTTQAASNYKLTSIVTNSRTIGNFTDWLGKRQAVLDVYTDFCNHSIGWTFDDIDVTWNLNIVPILTWKMTPCGHSDGNAPGVTILVHNGTFDDYINEFGDRLKTWLAGSDGVYGSNDDRRVYIRFGHEMNGNWYSWSNGSTPNDYILAWRHVYNIFSNKGFNFTRVQWIWSVNYQDSRNFTAEEYWVGENYTDWLGIDGYNWGLAHSWSSWKWPDEVLDDMLVRLRKLSTTKPLSLNEFGSTSIRVRNTSDPQSKTEWLNRFCDYLHSNQDIKMVSYFNVDEPENDWRVFDGRYGQTFWGNFTVYPAYKDCFGSNDWIEPNMTNPRLLTDDQFAGRI